MADESRSMPVLEVLAAMTELSVENCRLDPDTLMLVRIAALVAVDASAMSYLVNAGAAMDAGVTLEQVQDVLVAIAPIVGTPRITAAAGRITKALGLVIAVAEAELDEQES